MVKTPVLYKFLVVGIIVLVIGTGIQPSLADVSIEPNNNELEEVTIQFYDIDKCTEHKVMLSQTQQKELRNYFDYINVQLNSTDNPIEKETIYNNAIVKFNEFGLLPDETSVDYAQRLVSGKVQNPLIVKSIEKWYSKNKGTANTDENFLCAIIGYLDDLFAMGPFGGFYMNTIYKISELLENNYYLSIFLALILFPSFFIIFFPLSVFWWVFPFCIGCYLGMGSIYSTPDGDYNSPSRGSVFTIGLNGIKSWNGNLWGKIPRSRIATYLWDWFPGVLGFTGVKIGGITPNTFFMGSALWVKIKQGANP